MHGTLIFHFASWNRYSVHALAGAMETLSLEERPAIHFAVGDDDLDRCAAESLAKASGPVVVAFSFGSARRAESAWRAGRLRRDHGPAAEGGPLLIAGGPHATARPGEALGDGMDFVFLGEGEATLTRFMTALSRGENPREVPGLAWLDETGEVHRSPRAEPIDLDDWPPFPSNPVRAGHIEITRGCPFGCGYCQTTCLHGARPRHRSVEAILRAALIMGRAGRRDYRFISPNAFGYGSPDGRELNAAAVEGLLGELRRTVGDEARIFFGTFPSEVRPEHVTPETLGAVRRYCQNTSLAIGAQAGSDRMLQMLHRDHTAEDVRRSVVLTLEAGLRPSVDFIFGLPGETEDDLRATMDLIRELANRGARVRTHTFLPLPQTRLENASPGTIRPEVRQLMHELIPTGAVWGQWKGQEKLAGRMGEPPGQGKRRANRSGRSV